MSDFTRWWLGIRDLPVDSEGLRLAWEHVLPGWLWLVLVVGCVLIAVWSYARIDAPQRIRVLLASTRVSILVLLVIAIAGPMVELPRERVEPDYVAVLLDRSRSMQVRDGSGRTVDGQRSSREEILRRVVSEAGEPWRNPGDSRRLLWIGFGDGVSELPEPGASERSEPPVEIGEAEGWSTRLGPAIEEALRRTTGRPLAGVVLVTDGRTDRPPDRDLVRRLLGVAAPVHVVPLGAENPVGDAGIGRVESPRRVFARDAVPIVVEVENRGRSGLVRLELHDETSGVVLDTVEVEVDKEVDRLEAVLTARPTSDADGIVQGVRRWSVRIVDGDDLVPENDLASIDIELVDRPLRVLYIEGGPRWEYRYLKNLLLREPSIESSVMLLSADRDFAQEGNTPLARLPRDFTEFSRFDLVILGDLPASFLTEGRQEAIKELVERRGGGLVLLGGPRSMPETWTDTPLADLVPFSGGFDLDRHATPVMANPTAAAERLGVLRLSDPGRGSSPESWPRDLSDPSYGWSRLQWAQRIEPEQIKPTAEVLASATPVDEDSGAATPLVVAMRYGAGQILYVATDEIWRWRYGRGERLYERFWVQLLRLLGREAVESDVPVRITAGPERTELGRPVLVTVDLLDSSLGLEPPETVLVEAIDADGNVLRTFELSATGEATWSGSWIPEDLGPVSHRIADPGLSSLSGGRTVDVEVVRPDDELRLADADHPLLNLLARDTGGAMHRIADPGDPRAVLDRIHDVLPNRAIITETPIRERIWTSPLFFAMLLLLATLEWSGRRMARLD